MKKVKGSTIIITFMYVTWILYLVALVWINKSTGMWLPMEVTMATAALFIVETVSLARLKMAKEGTKVGQKKNNPFLEQVGLYNVPDFEEEVIEVQRNDENLKGNDSEVGDK